MLYIFIKKLKNTNLSINFGYFTYITSGLSLYK